MSTLRTVGQRDPLTEFKHEAFALFDEFGRNLRTEIAQDLFRFEILVRPPPTLQQLLGAIQLETNRSLVGDLEAPREEQPHTNGSPVREEDEERPIEKHQPVTVGPKTGRNDLCPCGSGKKYKKCCGALKENEV